MVFIVLLILNIFDFITGQWSLKSSLIVAGIVIPIWYILDHFFSLNSAWGIHHRIKRLNVIKPKDSKEC